MIKGIHHLGFTVRDAEASAAWYVEVLGFRRVGEHQAPDGAFRKVFLRHDNLPARIGLTEHHAGRKDVFDETQIGLDHLSFGVTDRAARPEPLPSCHPRRGCGVCRGQAALIGIVGRVCWSGLAPVQPVRVKSAVQLVSQVWPLSSENACSHRAVVAVMSDHL